MAFSFCGCGLGARSLSRMAGKGLGARLVGWKLSSSTMTKFDGNKPIMRRSRRSLPIHHDPSPALRHSMRSPSMKPRSLSVSPPHEYTARHQHGNRVGRPGEVFAIIGCEYCGWEVKWRYFCCGRQMPESKIRLDNKRVDGAAQQSAFAARKKGLCSHAGRLPCHR